MKHPPLPRAISVLVVGLMALIATTIFAQQFRRQRRKRRSGNDEACRQHDHQIPHQPEADQREAIGFRQCWSSRFLKELDPQKWYFLKSDVDDPVNGLNRYRDHLDELLKVGKVDYAYETFATLYLKTVG